MKSKNVYKFVEMSKVKEKIYLVRMTDSVHRKLKAHVTKLGMLMGAYVEQAVIEKMKNDANKK